MDYTDGTTFYFGDPFGDKTMRAVLNRIGRTLAINPRPVRCIFVVPVAEQSKAVQKVIANKWLAPFCWRAFPILFFHAGGVLGVDARPSRIEGGKRTQRRLMHLAKPGSSQRGPWRQVINSVPRPNSEVCYPPMLVIPRPIFSIPSRSVPRCSR